jgi:hypothetical protein
MCDFGSVFGGREQSFSNSHTNNFSEKDLRATESDLLHFLLNRPLWVYEKASI